MEKIAETTENSEELALKNENELAWERNHSKIAAAIAKYVGEYGTMPSKSRIAQLTGLNRDTIYKHVKAFAENPAEHNTLDTFSVMTEHIIANILRAALKGDLKAAHLYLESVRKHSAAKQITQQNNYLQINKTIINQQVIQQLKPEQLQRLEQLITAELADKGQTGADTFKVSAPLD